ncbi:cytochrome P450, partial [Trifolium medium]|nr:cytochrome P450 [Trifolium medium]
GVPFPVTNAYRTLIASEGEEPVWAGEIWNPLIPLKFSILAWRVFQNRLPTKENLLKRRIFINSSNLCEGGCGSSESEEHVLFNCPILSSVWKEIVRWLGIPIAFAKGGYDHFQMFKGLIPGRARIKDMLSIIWLSTVNSIWKARNEMIFNQVDCAGAAVRLFRFEKDSSVFLWLHSNLLVLFAVMQFSRLRFPAFFSGKDRDPLDLALDLFCLFRQFAIVG